MVLLSDVTAEFHNNTPDVFKVRLAEPMVFNGGWEVALTSLSIPDGGQMWGPKQKIMFPGQLTLEDAGQRPIPIAVMIKRSELQDQTLIVDGVDLMERAFEKEAFSQAQSKAALVKNETRFTFGWEGQSSVMDHKRLSVIKKPFSFSSLLFKVNTSLAVGMGWGTISTIPCLTTRRARSSPLPRRRRLEGKISRSWKKIF